MNTISTFFVSIFIGLASLFGFQQTPIQPDNLGVAVLPIAGSTYNLSGAGVSSSATSITLASLTIPQTGQKIQDSDLSSTFYITLEPGNRTRQELVSCTTVTQGATTATLSGCSRGLSPITPYTASSTLQFAHGGGSQVIFSDPPQLFNEFASRADDNTFLGVNRFNSYLPESSIQATTTNQFTIKGYVDSVALQGAATSTETVGGISILATALQQASSTDLGVTQPLVLQAKNATSTYNSATAGLKAVVTQNNGKIDQGFLDLTQDFAWTGSHTLSGLTSFTATSTFATTTQNGAMFGSNITNTMTAGETINGFSTPQAVMFSTTTNKVFLADADVASTTNFIGFVINNASTNGSAYVQTAGVVNKFSGLTAGADYYVQSTAGNIGTSIPDGAGLSESFVGYALSANQLLVNPVGSRDWQFVGSVSLNGNGDATFSPWARFAVISTTLTGDGLSNVNDFVISKIGKKTADFMAAYIGGVTYSVNFTWTSTSSIRSLMACTGGGCTVNQSSTIYLYR